MNSDSFLRGTDLARLTEGVSEFISSLLMAKLPLRSDERG